MTKRILAVEDSPTQGERVVAVLTAAGLDVVLARSGEEALEVMQEQSFDMVLSDVVMPGIDGYELCRRIKRAWPEMPVSLLTSLSDPFEVVRGLEAGADNFLHKPYEADELVVRIGTMLSNAELRASGRAQMGLEIYFLGQRFMITADRQQMLDLLVSTFEDLVTTHRDLRFRESQLAEAHGQLTAQLAATEHERRRLDAVLAAVPDAMIVTDEYGTVTRASAATPRVLGVSPQALVGRHAVEVADFFDGEGQPLDPDHRPLLTALARSEQCEAGGAFDLFLQRPDGARVPVIARSAPVHDDGGDVIAAIGLLYEIGGLASHDALTGLPGHALFADHVERAALRSSEIGLATAVLVIVIDRFDRVRESLPPAASDQVVAALGRRLQAALRSVAPPMRALQPSAAHLGGGEFAVVLPELANELDPVRIARLLGDDLAAPLMVEEVEIRLTTSIGIALADAGDTSPVQIISAAAAAARRASSGGGARYEVFDPTMSVRATKWLQAEADLRNGIEQGQLVVHYQPEVEIGTGRVVGAEALVRWEHPTRGMVAPADFIPLAEETGLILPLGWWVLGEACRQTAVWRGELAGADSLTISVNVSALQLVQPDVTEHVQKALADTGLDPAALLLEITETGFMAEGSEVVRSLDQLRQLGVKLRIDDFGTGYSSLIQLRRFSVDALKVDRSFVNRMLINPEDGAIVAWTVRLGHALGLQVVAEGVESEEQHAVLRGLGCDRAQGFLWSRPLPAGAFEERWREQKGRSVPSRSGATRR